MREHGRGDSMLVVPATSERWRESIVHPMRYAVAPTFRVLDELVRNEGRGRYIHRETGRPSTALAGLTAMDGATVINDHQELLAFGVKIGRPDGQSRVEHVRVTDPIEGFTPIVVHPSELGGTRHLSAF
jgi:hypothetical protein